MKPGDYSAPGWYRQPPGTQAYEWSGEMPETPRAAAPAADSQTLQVRKPAGHGGH